MSLFKIPGKWSKKLPTSTDDQRISDKSTVMMKHEKLTHNISDASLLIRKLLDHTVAKKILDSNHVYKKIQNGGTVFLGRQSCASFGSVNKMANQHWQPSTRRLSAINLHPQTTSSCGIFCGHRPPLEGFEPPQKAAIQHERTPFFSKQLIHCCAATHSKPFHLTSGAAWICCHLQGCVLLPFVA